MMHHRMYLRRCSMSSISEESETGDDEQLDEEFIICNDSPRDTPHSVENDDDEEYEVRHQSSSSTAMETCLDDLNSFKEVSALFFFYYFAYFLLTDSSISRFLFSSHSPIDVFA